jgi:hypothetical protein
MDLIAFIVSDLIFRLPFLLIRAIWQHDFPPDDPPAAVEKQNEPVPTSSLPAGVWDRELDG